MHFNYSGGKMNLDQQLDKAEDMRLSGDYDQAKMAYLEIITDENKNNINYAHAIRGIAESISYA